MFIALDQVVDPPLSQQICFCFFARASLTICRSLVHPFYTIDALPPSGSFELLLKFLLGPLFLDLIDSLLGTLALGEGFLFFVVDGLLIPSQAGMEGLFEIKIPTSHDDG